MVVRVRDLIAFVGGVLAAGLFGWLWLMPGMTGVEQYLIFLLTAFTIMATVATTDWVKEGEPTNSIVPGEYVVYGAELVKEEDEGFWFIFAEQVFGETRKGGMKAYKFHENTVHVQEGPSKKLEVIREGRLTKVVLTLPKSDIVEAVEQFQE